VWPLWWGQFWPQGYYLNNFGREPLDDVIYTKYDISGPCSFGQEDFWKLHIENLFFDPVTYLCNQSEQSEQKQFWYGTIQESFLVSLVKFPLAVQEKLSFELEKLF